MNIIKNFKENKNIFCTSSQSKKYKKKTRENINKDERKTT